MVAIIFKFQLKVKRVSQMSESDPVQDDFHKSDNTQLIQETEWARIYRVSDKHTSYKSKFLTDALQISAQQFAVKWPSMGLRDRLDFASAYSAKPDFTRDDEQVLEQIMRDGNEQVWSTLALFMLKHPDRFKILTFLRKRLEEHPREPDNFIQALGLSKDPGVSEVLLSYWISCREAAQSVPDREDNTIAQVAPIARYLLCCRALWQTTGSEDYLDQIRLYLGHAHSQVRWWAERALQPD